MSRHLSLKVATCLVLAALVRAVSGQEPTLAPPRSESNAGYTQSGAYTTEITPTAGEASTGPSLGGSESSAQRPANQGISGYPSVSYPSTAFPSQGPPPEPKGPPPGPPPGIGDDQPPGLLDSFESLYHDGIEPIVDGTTEWFSEGCATTPRKWQVHGWLNPGYSWNPDYPANNRNTPVAFNDRANEPVFNQVYTYLERRIEPDGCTWDFGARWDVMFGTDRRFLSATGLELRQDNSPKWNSGNYYGVAMPQLYAEMSAPVANGLTIKAGHFYSIFGFERIMAPDSFFYSHSYARVYGMPATHTGGLLTVYLPPNRFFRRDNIVLMTGITQGWDTWGHQNKDLSWLTGFMIDAEDLGITVSGAFIAGQEPVTNLGPSYPFGNAPFVTQDRWGWNLILSSQLTDRLGLVIENVGGSQAGGVSTTINGVTDTSPAIWYGLSNYLIYEVNDMWAGAFRFEWFHDQDYYRVQRTPVAGPGGFPYINHNYFAFTMGLNWRPRPNVMIRPEMRWDWADLQGNAAGGNPAGTTTSATRVFDDGSDGSQFLMSTDVIISF